MTIKEQLIEKIERDTDYKFGLEDADRSVLPISRYYYENGMHWFWTINGETVSSLDSIDDIIDCDKVTYRLFDRNFVELTATYKKKRQIDRRFK